MHTYKCTILRVVDGDTVDVDIDLGFGVWMRKERIRILGIRRVLHLRCGFSRKATREGCFCVYF